MTEDANDRQVGGSHYKKHGVQHWDYVVANAVPYLPAQVSRYVSRWADKNGAEDLEKALHYVDKMIEVHHNPPPPVTTIAFTSQLEQDEAFVVWGLEQYRQTKDPGTLQAVRDHIALMLGRAPIF